MSKIAIYPGSFDPVTYGHIDIIRRASLIFDEIIVGVANNTPKKVLFSVDERFDMVSEVCREFSNIRCEIFTGLVIRFAARHRASVLVRGLRMISDFEYELQMALTNRRLDESMETVFLMPSEGYSFLSSTLIKEAASLDADLTSFVPPFVARRLANKLKNQQNQD
jgi:pantetheine-phosphate adenylyltransferase